MFEQKKFSQERDKDYYDALMNPDLIPHKSEHNIDE
jgi:hypothetical protein